MKKIVAGLMILLGMSIFAEKLNSDGKSNINLIMGKWVNGTMEIKNYNGKLSLITISSDGEVREEPIKNYKNNVFVVQGFYFMPSKKDKNFYFAWDNKYKTLVEVDKDLNIVGRFSRKIKQPAG